MNLFYEITFILARLVIAGMAVTTVVVIGMMFHERYVEGNVDAFKPERRTGPDDRRVELPGH